MATSTVRHPKNGYILSFGPKKKYKAAHWDTSKNVTGKNKCPACDGSDWCSFDGDKNWLLCRRPAKANLYPAGWDYVKTTDKGNLIFQKADIFDQDVTAADLKTSQTAPAPEPEPCDQSDVELYHRVYTALLDRLELSPKHQKEIAEKRQLTQEEIAAMRLKSLPAGHAGISMVLADLAKKFGLETLCKIPGFYFADNRLGLNSRPGKLLIPSFDGQHITGIEISTGDPARKYVRLTSASEWLKKKGAAGPKAMLRPSVYRPLKAIPAHGVVGITEGAFKGFIAAQRTGMAFITVPGVGNWRQGTVELALQLAGPGGKAIVFYDQDENPATVQNVSLHKYALADALDRAGLVVELAEWDTDHKGIDDHLLAGGTFRTWRHLPGMNGLKANHIIDVPRLDYLPIDRPLEESRKASLIRSAKGTGKTFALTTEIHRTLAKKRRVLVIGHRVSLLSEACQRHGLEFYQDYHDREEWGDMSQKPGLAITFDSLPKLDLKKFKNLDLLVIDESEQALLHLTGETIKGKRPAVISYLNYLIKNAKKVVFMDADLSQTSYNYLARLIGPEKVEVIVNTHKPEPKTFIQYDRKAAMLDEIRGKLQDGKKIFVATNSRKAAIKLGRMLETAFPDLKGWLIHSHSVGTKEQQSAIANINQVIGNYDYIIASPTLGTGVSIDYPEIDTVFLLSEAGVNTHLDLMQQTARVRKPVTGEIHCWISPKRLNRPTDPRLIKEWAVKNAEETGIAIGVDEATGMRLAQPHEQFYLDLLADIEAARNASWSDLRGNFFNQAEIEGHTVIHAGDQDLPAKAFKESAKAYREAGEVIAEERIEGILAAEDITPLQYKILKKKKHLDEAEHAQLARHRLQQFYNQPEPDRELIEIDNEGRLQGQIINFLGFFQPDFAKDRDLLDYQYDPDNPPKTMLGEARNLYLTTSLRKEILDRAGLLGVNEIFTPISAQSLKERGFHEWAAKNCDVIGRILKIEVKTEQAIVRLVTSTLHQLGLEPDSKQYRTGETFINPKTGRVNAVRARQYWIKAEQFDRVRSLAKDHLAALEARKLEKEDELQSRWETAA